MNAKNTLTMISAADVITRPVVPIPAMTDCLLSPLASQCSRMCVIRNTS